MNALKKMFLFLVVATFMTQAEDADQQKTDFNIRYIDDAHITYYVTKITKELEYNAIHRKVVLGGALLGLGYITYQLMYGGQPTVQVPKTPIKEVPEDNPKSAGLPEKKEPVSSIPQLTADAILKLNNDGAKEKATKNLSLVPWVFVWAKENFSTLLQQTAVLALFTGLNNSLGPIGKYITLFDGAVDKLLDRVFHDGNLTWFLKRHTQLSILFATMEYHAAILENKPGVLLNPAIVLGNVQPVPLQNTTQLTQEKIEYHVIQLINAWNILIYQFEYVLGYMNYSIALPNRYQLAVLQAQALMETMKQEFDVCAQEIASWSNILINNYDLYLTTSLSDCIKMLHGNIEHDLNAFADLERLKPY